MDLNAKMVGLRIKEGRDLAGGMSQRDLADALGVGQSTVANWELGKRMVGLDDLVALGRALHRQPAWFLVDPRADPLAQTADGTVIVEVKGNTGGPTSDRLATFLEKFFREYPAAAVSGEPTAEELAQLYPKLSEANRPPMFYIEKAVPLGWEPGQVRQITDAEFDRLVSLLQAGASFLRKE